jgi:Na+-translocating ferredoxin:NAD+ oxidoreductase subunit C
VTTPSLFEDIVDKLNANEIWDFPGGVYPPQYKQLSNQSPIETLPIPERLYVPVKQHIGVEGQVIVEVGQHVLKGQALTKSMNPFAVPIHAPTSGHVISIAPQVSAHPSGLAELTIEIEADQLDTWITLKPLADYQNQPKMAVLSAICDGGISGMGGAGFPTHIKSAPKKNVEFLIINGIECEPYISSDDRLMREHAWQIRQGIDILTHLLIPKLVLIGIEDNKPEAIEAMRLACRENPLYRICIIPTKYPAGGEKQLIQMLTNREVPSGGLPMDVGVIMHNVGTCYAIADAIFSGKPLIQRVVTVTGQAVKQRGNYWTLIGTPIAHLLEHNQYQANKQKSTTVIMGGPMMGFTVTSQQVPVVKITNCILVPAKNELAGNNEQACIRCGACADVCPASLLPQQLFWHAKAKELDKAQDYNLFDCIECGACAFVCPSEIPLVHYYRIAKAEVRIEQQEKQKADKARERFETRAARLIADQEARDEKHRLAAEARKQAMAKSGNDAQDKIAAALARAKEKKLAQLDNSMASEPAQNNAGQSVSPETTTPSSNNERVQAAIARAKAKKVANANENQPVEEPYTSLEPASKNERVQAAIARAKAKKAASTSEHQSLEEQQATPEEASKNERIQGTIAKAKAKKAASTSEIQPVEDVQVTPEETVRNERVQAVIAKAKAKKAAGLTKEIENDKQSASDSALLDASPDGLIKDIVENEPLNEKQQRINVAVAKAKAKKQANQKKNTLPQNQFSAQAEQISTSADQEHVLSSQVVTNNDEDNKVLDDKKRRIAAAVAKAKAKKAAEQTAKDKSS